MPSTRGDLVTQYKRPRSVGNQRYYAHTATQIPDQQHIIIIVMIWIAIRINGWLRNIALDASGSVRNAFVWGQNAWLGSETQCAYLNEAPSFSLTASVPKAMDDRLIETIAPMPMLYRMVFSNFTSPYQVDSFNYLTVSGGRGVFMIIMGSAILQNSTTLYYAIYQTVHRLGICVPSACSDNEIAKLAQSFWSNRRLSHQRLYDMNASVVLVRSTDLTNFTDQSQFRWIFG